MSAFFDGNTFGSPKNASGDDGDVSDGFGPAGPNYPQAAEVPGSPGFPGEFGPNYAIDAGTLLDEDHNIRL